MASAALAAPFPAPSLCQKHCSRQQLLQVGLLLQQQLLGPDQLAEGSHKTLMGSAWDQGVLLLLDPHPAAALASGVHGGPHKQSDPASQQQQGPPGDGRDGQQQGDRGWVSGLVVCGGATAAADYDPSRPMSHLSAVLASLEALSH
eukprot:gene9261-9426_t